jgi:ABC-type amino acid transport substrate-binding protein
MSPFEPVHFQRIAEVIEAMKAGDVDFTISNATPARAIHVAFSQTLISLELGYLVSAASPIAAISDAGKPGLRIGVTRGEHLTGHHSKTAAGCGGGAGREFKARHRNAGAR